MPRTSVIIPTFNRARFLGEAVESVLSQRSVDGFELIVVDDGSTDETPALLEQWPEVRAVRTENLGVSAARNAGVAKARGEFIAFLDSDDLWLPEKLAHQEAFFSENPGAVACQTEEIWLRRGVRVNPGQRHRKPDGDVFSRSLILCVVSPSAVMLKKDVFTALGGFDETLPACEDYDLWLRLSCRHPVHLVHEPLMVKRGGRKDQLSAQPGLDAYRIRALVKLIENEPLTPKMRAAAIKALHKKARVWINGCEKRGREEEARYWRQALAPYGNAESRGENL